LIHFYKRLKKCSLENKKHYSVFSIKPPSPITSQNLPPQHPLWWR